ncbi:MAG: carbamoyltransferase HypF [Dehalococcoidia bacterium]|nr:carbamoyltransferase HypF [Dehalococcoidia bacterium]
MAVVVKDRQLLHVEVRGVVQGVGFRPFVYQLAVRHNLGGWVCNTSGAVIIEVEGEKAVLDRFLPELESTAPPESHIESISALEKTAVGYERFDIRPSIVRSGEYQLISPDLATCDACREDIADPHNRRYRYPFTNCTNCGPRFTIIEDIPYDRSRTTMRHFEMCPECHGEYDNPLERRFHAQPNACSHCGPALELVNSEGNNVPCEDVLNNAAQLLKQGKILAIKGLGGFLLACDATSDEAVTRLRQRKRRQFKPLAIMVTSTSQVEQYCWVSPDENEILNSSSSPIVLLKWKPNSLISAEVAPGLKYLGVMLPYTPLHHLLMAEVGLPLVMTSGNFSEEPIIKDNDEALRRLSGIADYLLMHNRGIFSQYDDSVTQVELGKTQVLRRARGYAPYPITLTFQTGQILACGAELKNTFCLIREKYAFISQHIGDLKNMESMDHYEDTIELYKRLFRIEPAVVAYDMHPDYLSTKYAMALQDKGGDLDFMAVQHHHAHIASCLADNGVQEKVIGIAFDGTGYGTDGAIWGGEVLVADMSHFERVAHFEYVPLPGGAASIKKPYRMAVSYLYHYFGEDIFSRCPLSFMKQVSDEEIGLIKKAIDGRLNCPMTSSCGRLFDALSSLIGIRGIVDYDAQAVVEMEMAATGMALDAVTDTYPYGIKYEDSQYIVCFADLFMAVIEDLRFGKGQGVIARKVHNTTARIILDVCSRVSKERGVNVVALSGGVFQNRLLLRQVSNILTDYGFTVLTHSKVPCNDGGISLGQAVIASARLS